MEDIQSTLSHNHFLRMILGTFSGRSALFSSLLYDIIFIYSLLLYSLLLLLFSAVLYYINLFSTAVFSTAVFSAPSLLYSTILFSSPLLSPLFHLPPAGRPSEIEIVLLLVCTEQGREGDEGVDGDSVSDRVSQC